MHQQPILTNVVEKKKINSNHIGYITKSKERLKRKIEAREVQKFR